MKRKIVVLASTIFSLLLLATPYAMADALTLDQSCNVSSPLGFAQVQGQFLSQSFVPTQNRIGQIELYLDATAGDTVSVGLSTNADDWVHNASYDLYEGTLTVGQSGQTYQSISFSAVTLTPGQTYWIFMENAADASLGWAYSDPSGDNLYTSGRPNGYITYGDMGFKTYGYNYSAPIPTPTPTPTPTLTPTPTPTPTPSTTGTPTTTTDTDQTLGSTLLTSNTAAKSNSKTGLIIIIVALIAIIGGAFAVIKIKHINLKKLFKKS
jgi:hypothetical protein